MRQALFVLSLLLLPVGVPAAILPDTIGAYHRTAFARPALSDQPVWNDYGLKDRETDQYENGTAKFKASAWQLQDTTGSMAAFQWLRPADSKESKLATLAAETPTGLLWVDGNYLVSLEGYKPAKAELDALGQALKNVDRTALPVLPSYLPSNGLTANSERYVTGPASLARFDPAI